MRVLFCAASLFMSSNLVQVHAEELSCEGGVFTPTSFSLKRNAAGWLLSFKGSSNYKINFKSSQCNILGDQNDLVHKFLFYCTAEDGDWTDSAETTYVTSTDVYKTSQFIRFYISSINRNETQDFSLQNCTWKY